MNKERRKKLSDICNLLEEVRDEEQEALDNLPESLQLTEKGENMERNIDAIEDARGELEELIQLNS